MHARLTAALLVATALCAPSAAFAASFHVINGTQSAPQALGTNETGQIDLGAALTVSGQGAAALTIGGSSDQVINNGTISSTTDRAIDTSYKKNNNITLSITNSGLI